MPDPSLKASNPNQRRLDPSLEPSNNQLHRRLLASEIKTTAYLPLNTTGFWFSYVKTAAMSFSVQTFFSFHSFSKRCHFVIITG